MTPERFLEELKHVQYSFAEYTGKLATIEDIVLSLRGKDEIVEEIEQETWTDTNIREWIAETISMHLIGMETPMYGDTQEYKDKFNARIQHLPDFDFGD